MKSWKEIIEKQPKVGKLSNFKFHHKNEHKHIFLEADCECGNKTIKRATEILKANRISSLISCNCGQKEIVKKQGLKNRKYTINDKIYKDSEMKSYFIGFVAADGCNLGDSLEITIQKQDIDILNKFKWFLDYTGNIKIHKDNKVTLKIHDRSLCKYLESQGITKRKSLIYKVPDKYKTDNHFWRGYIDGDGCIFKYKYGKIDFYGLSLIGTKETLISFCEHFKINNKITKMKNTNVYQVAITGKKSIPVLQKLYSNMTIALNRKCYKVNEIEEYFKGKIHE